MVVDYWHGGRRGIAVGDMLRSPYERRSEWSAIERRVEALKVASESGCKSTGRFAASWVSIRAGELK